MLTIDEDTVARPRVSSASICSTRARTVSRNTLSFGTCFTLVLLAAGLGAGTGGSGLFPTLELDNEPTPPLWLVTAESGGITTGAVAAESQAATIDKTATSESAAGWTATGNVFAENSFTKALEPPPIELGARSMNLPEAASTRMGNVAAAGTCRRLRRSVAAGEGPKENAACHGKG